jgi:hypothetical protein
MLWLVKGDFSHQIISCNIHEENGVYQLWITRPNGKSMKLKESRVKDDVSIIKEAIDYAIEQRESVLRLDEPHTEEA